MSLLKFIKYNRQNPQDPNALEPILQLDDYILEDIGLTREQLIHLNKLTLRRGAPYRSAATPTTRLLNEKPILPKNTPK